MQMTVIQSRIFEIRGQQVMIDFHLAELYEVPTKSLNLAVKRNLKRFPDDFMFQLTKEEFENLRFQIETSSHGGRRYLPFAFTEQGVAMLSSVLKSEKAIEANIAIIRTFVLLRQYALNYKELQEHIKQLEEQYDHNFKQVFEALELLLQSRQEQEDFSKRRRIGFKQD